MITESLAVIDAVEALLEPGRGPIDSPPHSTALKPLYRKAKRIWARYFRRQGEAIVTALEPAILMLFDGVREATAVRGIPDLSSMLPLAFHPLTFALPEADELAYIAALRLAIARAGAILWREMGVSGALPESIASLYLQTHGLEKLTGQLSQTTIQLLRTQIAKSYQGGGTFSTIVADIKAMFAEFSDARAEMIAQTELNDAYNYGRVATAALSGMNEKAWDVESGPCPICAGNHGAGWININSAFPSGHLAPTAHPRCVCGLSFRLRTGGQQIIP